VEHLKSKLKPRGFEFELHAGHAQDLEIEEMDYEVDMEYQDGPELLSNSLSEVISDESQEGRQHF
jgi:hypothetical protein